MADFGEPRTPILFEPPGLDGRPVYRWLVEIDISESVVESGFTLDDDNALRMLQALLPYANASYEIGARVIAAPDPAAIRKAQTA